MNSYLSVTTSSSVPLNSFTDDQKADMVQKLAKQKIDNLDEISSLANRTLEFLDLSDHPYVNLYDIDCLSTHFPSLKEVNLVGCNVVTKITDLYKLIFKKNNNGLEVPTGIRIQAIGEYRQGPLAMAIAHSQSKSNSRTVNDTSYINAIVASGSWLKEDLEPVLKVIVQDRSEPLKKAFKNLVNHRDFDPNAEICKGKKDTFLHWFCQYGNMGLSQIILSHPNIHIDALDIDYKTPLDRLYDAIEYYRTRDLIMLNFLDELKQVLICKGAKRAAQ
ncbi:MAG: hypothetical protein K0S74_747 [Chlamydiales bacterium]|jgi:hypothetical protein|nr:hypothetical protein [Chlamydiales bacterium]